MKSAERKSAFIESALHDDPREEDLERLGQVQRCLELMLRCPRAWKVRAAHAPAVPASTLTGHAIEDEPHTEQTLSAEPKRSQTRHGVHQEREGPITYGMDTTPITFPSDSHESFTRVVAWGANLDPADFGVIP